MVNTKQPPIDTVCDALIRLIEIDFDSTVLSQYNCISIKPKCLTYESAYEHKCEYKCLKWVRIQQSDNDRTQLKHIEK